MHGDAGGARGGAAGLRQARAGGVGDADMAHAAGPEEGLVARDGAVDELIHEHEIARRAVLAERPAGRDRDHVGDTKPFERVDIGAVGHGRGGMDMAAPVAGQKGHRHTLERAGEDRVGWRAPRGFDLLPRGPLQPVDLVESRAADHPDHRLCHSPKPPRLSDVTGEITPDGEKGNAARRQGSDLRHRGPDAVRRRSGRRSSPDCGPGPWRGRARDRPLRATPRRWGPVARARAGRW